MTTRVRQSKTFASPELIARIDSIITWITLATLFLVPLVFAFNGFVSVFSELKLVTLHLGAALIAILWLWQSTLTRVPQRTARQDKLSFDLIGWVGRNPARWTILLASLWLISQGITAILSPLTVVSFFGSDDARSGYNLYDNISLFIVFLSVALRFRSQKNLQLLISTLVASGTVAALYGVGQHFGFDPLGDSAGRNRVWSSFGNPLNFGSYMVMSIPATLAMAYFDRERRVVWLAGLSVALGLQLAGLWFSGGRGPYISFAASLIVLLVAGSSIAALRSLSRLGLVLLFGVVVASVIALLPSPSEDIALSRVLSIGDQIIGTDTESNAGGIESGLEGRFEIWGRTLDEATSWKTPQDDSALNAALRPVFGLGQDMYIYSYPLVGKAHEANDLVDHPHNFELQILMEQGVLGLLLFVGTVIALLLTALNIVRRADVSNLASNPINLLILALIPATIGKLVEMQTGISRVSDLAMTFALFGSIVALSNVVSSMKTEEVDSDDAPKQSPARITLKPDYLFGVVLLSAAAVTVISAVLFFGWDVRRLSASQSWAAAIDAPTDLDRATGWFESQKEAPERPSFTNSLFIELFNAALDQHESGNTQSALQLMHTARQTLLDYQEREPYKRDTQINLFKTEITLALWGQPEFGNVAVQRTELIFNYYPAYPTLLSIVANDLKLIGQEELAAEYLAKITPLD